MLLDLNKKKSYEREFGKHLKQLRNESHMTQEDVVAKMQLNGSSMTRGTYAKIEAGVRHVYVDEILEIKKAMNLSFEELFSEDS